MESYSYSTIVDGLEFFFESDKPHILSNDDKKNKKSYCLFNFLYYLCKRNKSSNDSN